MYGDLTVRENLRYFGRLLGASPARADELLETVSLAGLAGRVVGGLSGGKRARVSLATALMGAPSS